MARLTDEELVSLHKLATHDASVVHVGSVLIDPSTLLEVTTELRERRAADLTDEERAALVNLHTWLEGRNAVYLATWQRAALVRQRAALAVLDRIIGGIHDGEKISGREGKP